MGVLNIQKLFNLTSGSKDISSSEQHFLTLLAFHANDKTRECFFTNETGIDETKMTLKTYKKARNSLAARGFIKFKRGYRTKDGKWATVFDTLFLDGVAKADPIPEKIPVEGGKITDKPGKSSPQLGKIDPPTEITGKEQTSTVLLLPDEGKETRKQEFFAEKIRSLYPAATPIDIRNIYSDIAPRRSDQILFQFATLSTETVMSKQSPVGFLRSIVRKADPNGGATKMTRFNQIDSEDFREFKRYVNGKVIINEET